MDKYNGSCVAESRAIRCEPVRAKLEYGPGGSVFEQRGWLGLTSQQRVRGQRLTGVNGIVRLQSAAHEAIAFSCKLGEDARGIWVVPREFDTLVPCWTGVFCVFYVFLNRKFGGC